jgi:enterochelin esterase family protein
MTMRLPIDPAGDFKLPPPYKGSAGNGSVRTPLSYYVTSAVGVQVFDPTSRLCGVLPIPQSDKPLTSCTLADPAWLSVCHQWRQNLSPQSAGHREFLRATLK